MREVGPSGKDRTDEYKRLAAESLAGGRNVPQNATNFHYLFVPGLMTEHYGERYMQQNLQRCTELGLSFSKADIDTDHTVAFNAEVIRKAVVASTRPVILIGHSKGGVDAAAALMLYPEIQGKVHALVTMQSPYGGTHVANFIKNTSPIFTAAKGAIESIFKGDVNAIVDLSYESRRAFLAQNPLDTSKVKTLAYRTQAQGGLMGLVISFLKSTYDVDSDGLVPVLDAAIPGADDVYISGVDHGSSVGLALGEKDGVDKPADITQALICMACVM